MNKMTNAPFKEIEKRHYDPSYCQYLEQIVGWVTGVQIASQEDAKQLGYRPLYSDPSCSNAFKEPEFHAVFDEVYEAEVQEFLGAEVLHTDAAGTWELAR